MDRTAELNQLRTVTNQNAHAARANVEGMRKLLKDRPEFKTRGGDVLLDDAISAAGDAEWAAAGVAIKVRRLKELINGGTL